MYFVDTGALAYFLVLMGLSVLVNYTDLRNRLESVGNLALALCVATAAGRLLMTLVAVSNFYDTGPYIGSSLLIVLYAALANAVLHVVATLWPGLGTKD